MELGPATPNPAADEATFSYAVPASDEGAPLEMVVFDLQGRRVRSLVVRNSKPGYHAARWDLRADSGGRVRPGMYFVRLKVGAVLHRRSVLVTP